MKWRIILKFVAVINNRHIKTATFYTFFCSELHKRLHQRSTRERSLNLPARDSPKPVSKEIMDKPVSANYITPKIAFFTGVEDLENHLTTFNAQMIISGGTDVIRCKMFMDTFTNTTLQWFSRIPDGQITYFSQFSRMFRYQFSKLLQIVCTY